MGSSYTYDAEGNQIAAHFLGPVQSDWAYAYDDVNHLVGVTYSVDGGLTIAQRVTYTYDAFGNRVGRAYWNGTTTATEHFAFDGWDTAKPRAIGHENFEVWVDLDASNQSTTRRWFGSQFDELVARQDAAGVVNWYATDDLGSVRQVFDNSGSVVASRD